MGLIWLGQVLSQAGTRMYQIAMLWWIITASTDGAGRHAGLFMVAGAVPALLFVKLIGRCVDRGDSKPLLVSCDILSSLAVATVGLCLLASRLSLAWVYGTGFAVALLQAFFDPALNKAVSEAVSPEDIEEAVALQSSTQYLASFGGAVAGALLIDRAGLLGVVWLNALSFAASAVFNSFLKLKYRVGRNESAEAARADISGWEILRRMPLIRKTLIGSSLANFFMTPILVILPLYTKETLGGGASLLGQLEASLWIGLLTGTLSSKWSRFPNNILHLGAACFFSMGLCLLLQGLIVERVLFAALLFCAGAALGVNNVKSVALYQEIVRPEWKGRFFAVTQAILSFTFPLAYFLFGLLADRLSPPKVCIIQGVGVLSLAGYFLFLALEEESPKAAGKDALLLPAARAPAGTTSAIAAGIGPSNA